MFPYQPSDSSKQTVNINQITNTSKMKKRKGESLSVGSLKQDLEFELLKLLGWDNFVRNKDIID